MPVKPMNIFCYYDRARFIQVSPQDCANWYLVEAPTGKRKMAMYPTMGRKHISVNGINVLQFKNPPRYIFKSINYMYVVVASTVYQVNSAFTAIALTNDDFNNSNSVVNFAFLPLVSGSTPNDQQAVYVMLTDGNNCYVIDETQTSPTMVTVTDTNAPPKPNAVAAFGNRFVVSSLGSTEFRLTAVNCFTPGMPGGFDAAQVFTVNGLAVFAQESGIIRQFAVLKTQLYMFTDYTTGVWANTESRVTNFQQVTTTFPWRKNTSYDWDYGIADPQSVDTDFGIMIWLAQNRNGLVSFVMSDGGAPQSISTQAITTVLQQSASDAIPAGFKQYTVEGFLYQYEDTIFYRVSAGPEQSTNPGLITQSASSLEYNVATKTWHRCIEVDGDRNLISQHVFYNSLHVVTVLGQNSLYQMAGNIYTNEFENPDATGKQAPDKYLAYPMRYELVTPIIAEDDYSEFITDYVQIDFVFGEQTFVQVDGSFNNTVYIVSENPDASGNPVYMVAEDGQTYIIQEGTNTPQLADVNYSSLFKPHIELYVSDDGGVNFYSADVLEFSQLGVYSWRMRWYQNGVSRNRVYKLVCVSPSPIVILGAVQSTRRASGGAN